MKIGGHSVTFGWKGKTFRLGDRLCRARHFRGHGVHSPFVYDLVREVFMRHDLLPGDRKLYQTLLLHGVPVKRAIQLQNLALHCRYEHFGLNCADADLCILLPDLTCAETVVLLKKAAETKHTVVLYAPYSGHDRQTLCSRIVALHRSTTVDNRAYLLIFNNHLPKQHFLL